MPPWSPGGPQTLFTLIFSLFTFNSSLLSFHFSLYRGLYQRHMRHSVTQGCVRTQICIKRTKPVTFRPVSFFTPSSSPASPASPAQGRGMRNSEAKERGPHRSPARRVRWEKGRRREQSELLLSPVGATFMVARPASPSGGGAPKGRKGQVGPPSPRPWHIVPRRAPIGAARHFPQRGKHVRLPVHP